MTLHRAPAWKGTVLRVLICGWFAVFPACLALFAAGPALGDLYKWTDERGTTVLSNIRPDDPRKVKNFEVLVKETKRAGKTPGASAPHEITPTERMLLDRIEDLEGQLRSQQYAQTAAPPPAASYGSYSPAPPPPPSYADTYYPAYYPAYYYPYYTSYYSPYFPVFYYRYPVSHFHAHPVRAFGFRPGLAFPRGGFARGGSVHHARR